MLLTVGGGGFFSSSASGYSKGLSLLILSCKNKEKHMRVSPWNQYQLVDQEFNPQFQLAPTKKQVFHRCASFVCFGRASAGVNGTSPPKVGPAHHSETSTNSSGKESATGDAVDEFERKICLKSSLKKPFKDCSVLSVQAVDTNDSLREAPNSTAGFTKRRKLQWTDTCGKELVEIKEFEPSDDNLSDDEYDYDGNYRCQCVIQ